MPRLSGRRTSHVEEDEGYFISMSDMLTGLLFVFIILVFYFALQLRKSEQELTGAKDARAKLLEDIQKDLKKREVDAEIDKNSGVLRLQGVALFGDDDANLTDEGRRSVDAVAAVLAQRLPCFTDDGTRACAGKGVQRVETLMVEGHTDARPRMRGGRDTNIDLSTMRAINTFVEMRTRQPGLDELSAWIDTDVGPRLRPILSVSGYGSTRPVPGFESSAAGSLQKNRRIDLRFLMVTRSAARLKGTKG